MGCDIHSIAQVKKNGKWQTVYQDVAGDHRNYDTFAVLADVRNGSGFAGIDTGDGFIPISQPRGLPDDLEVDEEEGSYAVTIPMGTPTGTDLSWADAAYREQRTKDIAEETTVWLGDHSHSWLTLAEIKAYVQKVAKMKTIKRGVVSEEEYLKLREAGEKPTSYSGGIWGRNIVTMSMKEYIAMEASGKRPEGEIHVRMQWEENYLDTGYIPEIVEELTALAKRHEVSEDEVRMVFGFDS